MSQSTNQSPLEYRIERIPSTLANQVVVANHYLHRKAPASYAYGLFDGQHLLGTIIYGKPASPSLCRGVCGPEETSRVIELTRLWIADETPKNTESFLIGRTLRMLPPEFDIVVSYAEIGAGHVGTVYQATNWIYTGLSDRHVDYRIDGLQSGKHSRHLFDEFGGIEGAKKALGDRLIKTERPRKHRYVYFLGSPRRRRDLRKKLRYEIQPYPKREAVS